MTARTTMLGELIARLKQGETVPLPDREGRITAMIDPMKTTKVRLEAVLKERGVLK